MFNSLSGYRTYICAGIIGVLSVLHYLGYLDSATYNSLVALLGAGGVAALRAAVTANAGTTV